MTRIGVSLDPVGHGLRAQVRRPPAARSPSHSSAGSSGAALPAKPQERVSRPLGIIAGRLIVMVQMSELERIRQDWIKRGSPPCEHKRTAKEFYLGTRTGDQGCLDCGECPVDDAT